MEMTKMLLPAVPVATKINDEYSNYFYNLDLDLRKCFLLRLQELELKREQQRLIEYTAVVRQQANQLKNDLLSYESKSRDCAKQRNAHLTENSNEGIRNNNAVRITTTTAEKKKEIKLLRMQPKPELLLESKPKPESERKLIPQLKAEQKIKLELEPKPEPELELEPGVLEWKRELEKQTEPKNQELELDRDSDIEYMETCDEFCGYLENSDSEIDSITKIKMNFDAKRLKAYANKRRRKRIKRQIFMCNKKSGHRMFSRTQFYQNLENKNKRSYLQNDNIQMLNMANRSLLKSQHNVNITPSCTLGANNFHQSSTNNQKQLCNQDHQEKNISQQILMNEENVDIMQLLKDDLPKTTIDPEEELSFLHDQINVSEKFSEYIIRGASTIMPCFSENDNITQRAKTEENQRQVMEAIRRNTLSDHCYHLNEPRTEQSDLSESDDEEIDVVSFEKQMTCSNFTQPQRRTSRAKPAAKIPDNVPVVRRPRGRPPGSNSAKRKVQPNRAELGPAPKRSRVQNSQQSTARQNRNFVDKQMPNDKRNLHNDMERQRRVELKEFFEILRSCVPEIAENERASKVSILQKAEKYIKSLKQESELLMPEIEMLQKKQVMLKNNLRSARELFYRDNKK